MAEPLSREELDQRARDEVRARTEEQEKAHEEARKEQIERFGEAPGSAAETPEEYEERVATVRRTQVFGDTPTDPTIGDAVVPSNDEEAATVSTAEADLAAEDGDEEAQAQSPEEKKRQAEDGLTTEEQDDLDDDSDEDSEDSSDDESQPETASEKVEAIKAANSEDEVNSLADGDDRVTVQQAADRKRAELNS